MIALGKKNYVHFYNYFSVNSYFYQLLLLQFLVNKIIIKCDNALHPKWIEKTRKNISLSVLTLKGMTSSSLVKEGLQFYKILQMKIQI